MDESNAQLHERARHVCNLVSFTVSSYTRDADPPDVEVESTKDGWRADCIGRQGIDAGQGKTPADALHKLMYNAMHALDEARRREEERLRRIVRDLDLVRALVR